MAKPEIPKDQQDALRLLARHHFYLRNEERHLVRLVALARREGTPWHLIGRVLGITRQAAMKRYSGVPDDFADVELPLQLATTLATHPALMKLLETTPPSRHDSVRENFIVGFTKGYLNTDGQETELERAAGRSLERRLGVGDVPAD